MNTSVDPSRIERTIKAEADGEGSEDDNDGKKHLETSATQYSTRQLRSKKIKPSPKPLVEEFFYDRSPTKPRRQYSPARTRGADKEREKVELFGMKVGGTLPPNTYQNTDSFQESQDRRHAIPLSTLPFPPYPFQPSDVGVGYLVDDNREPYQSHRQANHYPFEDSDVLHGRQSLIVKDEISNTSRKVIQVAPNVFVPLRGSEETWEAIKDDFYMPGLCVGCDSTIFVIQDAAYVLCPDCRTVSPMDGNFVDRLSAGVGLGFTYEDLMRWQAEILQVQNGRL